MGNNKVIDRVKYERTEFANSKVENISEVMQDAADRYMKIRADQELIESDCGAIVSHIKSYPDWEYFIDAFLDDKNALHLPFSMFNDVMVYPNKVILKYSPLHYRFDANNHTYGSCTFDDIMNIEKIIEERKEYYKANN